jgi:Protein of unknown function (DUF2934)
MNMANAKASIKLQRSTRRVAASPAPTNAQIAQRAYYRYLERGRIDGSDLDDWFAAEADLRSGSGDTIVDAARVGERPPVD